MLRKIILAACAAALMPMMAAATDPSEVNQGYDADAVAMIAAIEARESSKASDKLNLPTMRVRGKRLSRKTGSRLFGESAPEGDVLFTDVDEAWRAKHQW